MGKGGLIVSKELKRFQSSPVLFDRFIKSNVSRLLKSYLVSVLAEFQRQNLVFLAMKLYDVERKETWYWPDMFFYRDMLMMLTRNKKVDEVNRVWEDLKKYTLISILLVTLSGPSWTVDCPQRQWTYTMK